MQQFFCKMPLISVAMLYRSTVGRRPILLHPRFISVDNKRMTGRQQKNVFEHCLGRNCGPECKYLIHPARINLPCYLMASKQSFDFGCKTEPIPRLRIEKRSDPNPIA